MDWRERVVRLADRCNIDPYQSNIDTGRCNINELDEWMHLIKQGHEHLLADLEAEPTTRKGKAILKALRKQSKATSPDLEKIKIKLDELETMRVSIRTYPLVDGALVQRIQNSEEINEEDLVLLARNIDHIIKQDRVRPPGRGAGDIARDTLVIELAGLWTDLTGRDATYTTNPYGTGVRTGDFIEFVTGVADIIGVDHPPMPEQFKQLKAKMPDI